MAERLQKLISAAGIASRRAAEKLIASGRVTVNGRTASLGESAEPKRDTVCVDGRPLSFGAARTYIMLHKPRGYVTTLSDERGRPTAAELVRDAGVRLYPVGRLDMDSEGLLLFTNDGAFANALMHPSHEIDKVYRTVVSGSVAAALPRLRTMRELDGEPIRAPRVDTEPDGALTITIHEGKNRQVRRMCAAAGLRVERLTRVAEGPLTLGDLPEGKWRYLTADEVNSVK